MAGGAGTRFWPLSRRDRPKQLLDLCEPDVPMLAATVRRVRPLAEAADILVVTGENIADDVAKFIRKEDLTGEEINECASEAPHQRLGVSASVLEVLCGKVQAELEEAEKLYMGDQVPA